MLLLMFIVLWLHVRKRYNLWKAVCYAFLPIYVAMLFASLVCSRPIHQTYMVKMQLFWTIKEVLHGETQYITEIILNCFMLFPVGFLYPMINESKSNIGRCIAIGGLISASIELMQLLTKTGMCEIDDFLYNVAGCMAGYSVYRLYTLGKNILYHK